MIEFMTTPVQVPLWGLLLAAGLFVLLARWLREAQAAAIEFGKRLLKNQ